MAQQQQQNMNKIKVCLVGNCDSGKSTFAKRLRTGELTTNYVPTMGVEVNPIILTTSKGRVCLNVWDTAGPGLYAGLGLGGGYYAACNHFIVFVDNSKAIDSKELENHITTILDSNGDAKITLALNKVDTIDQESKMWKSNAAKISSIMGTYSLCSYYVSCKSNYNIDKPYLNIMKDVLGEDLTYAADR